MKNADLIRRLNKAMTRHGFRQIEVAFGGCSCRLVVSPSTPTSVALADSAATGETPDPGMADHGEELPEIVAKPEPIKVTAERVGVFRGRKDLLEIGQTVASGEVLGIIRGISFQDQIASPREGRVASIHIQEGEIVEFGRLLFCLDPEPNGP